MIVCMCIIRTKHTLPPELLPTDPEDVLCVTTYTLEGLSTLLDRIAFATAFERTQKKRIDVSNIT